MQEVARVLSKPAAAWFCENNAVIHEQQGSTGQRLDLMHQDLAAVEHRGDFDLIPLMLGVRKFEIGHLVEESLQARNALCSRHVWF